MPADFSLPVIGTAYATFLSTLKERDVDAITLCLSDPSNIPTGAIKWNRSTNLFQEWSGTAWVDKTLAIAGGGTGAVTAGAARTALGLGDMATQASSAVAITGGTIAGVTANANIITSGLIAQARLGSGSGGAGLKFLADDQTYKEAEVVGSGKIWFTNVAPTGYLIMDGSAISRATYAALFAVIGTTWGSGDGATTFNLPDFRGRYPFGKAASGTGNTLAGTFGSVDHVHTGPSHTHTYTEVPNHTHSVTDAGHTHSYSKLSASSNTGDNSGGGYDFANGNTTQSTNSTVATLTCANPTGGVATGTTAAGGTGNTGTANPPSLVVNFIIKY